MNSSYDGEFNATQTTEGASAEKKAEGIVPVLINQVLTFPEGNLKMFDMTFMVYVKAIIRNIETSSAKITYLLEDSTGRIDAHYWYPIKTPDVMVNKYATVFGRIKCQGGQKTLNVFKMLPVNDPNEVVTHVLEVLNARYKAKEFATKCFGDYGSVVKPSGGGNDVGLEGKHLAVFQAIKNHNSNDGITRSELKRKFTHMSANELDPIMDFLTAEGHIYSSIDADHFLSTE